MQQQLLRIVPPASREGGLTLCQGTQVLTQSGEAIGGIHKITLHCEVNDLWRAEIHCTVQPTDLSALSRIYRPTGWQRFKQWCRDVIGGFRMASETKGG